MFGELGFERQVCPFETARSVNNPRQQSRGFDDIERLTLPLAAPYLDGGRIQLFSITQAHDGSQLVLDYRVQGIGPRARLTSAQETIARATELRSLTGIAGTELRVEISPLPLDVDGRRQGVDDLP